MTVKYGGFTFNTFVDRFGYYKVAFDNTNYQGTSNARLYSARYEEIKDEYFTASYNVETSEYAVKVLRLTEIGSGAIDGNNLNGGYKKIDAGRLFVDKVDDSDGILFLENEVVAFTPEGKFYVVSVTYGRDENGKLLDKDFSKATFMYGPEMQRVRDDEEREVYSRFNMSYLDPETQQTKTFTTDGADAEYQRILQRLLDADLAYNLANNDLPLNEYGQIDRERN